METKKILSIILTVASAILILDSFNFAHTFIIFLLIGVVPGTSIDISADTMLNGFVLIAGFTLSRITMSLAISIYRRFLLNTYTATQL